MTKYVEPDFLPWDGRRVPLTFVSGYLGAGKTTLINDLLGQATRPVAVLVNDVGTVNIDARLIKRHLGDTIELTDGCVCCSLSDGFGAAFDQLRLRDVPPDHVVVELSGIAHPDRVLPWASTAGFRLDGVVTLVDTEQLQDLLANPISAQCVEAQIVAADLIVLTKGDVAGPTATETASARLRALAPNVPLVDNREVSVGALLHLGGRQPEGVTGIPQATLFDRHVVDLQPLPNPIPQSELESLLEDLPDNVVRAKGVAADPDGVLWLAQKVGRRVTVITLPQAETQAPTDLVTISVS